MDSKRSGKHGAGTGARDSAAARGLSNDAIKLLKTQDAGYLRVVGEKVRREKEKLERETKLQQGFQDVLVGHRGDDGEEEVEEGAEDDFDFDLESPWKVVFADSQQDQRELKHQIERHDGGQGNDDEEEVEDLLHQRKKSNKQLDAERQALVESRRARKTKKRAAEARHRKLDALAKQHREIVAAQRELEWQRAKMEHSVGGTNKDGIKWKIRERKR